MSIIEQLNTNPIANHAAEKTVIGTLLVRFEDCTGYVRGLLPRDFDRKEHQMIFRAMRELQAKKKAVDMVTLSEYSAELKDDRMIDVMVDATQHSLISSAQLPSYVEILKRATARRDFAVLGKNLQEESAADEFDAAKITERIRVYLKNMGQTDGEETHIREALMNLHDRVFKPREKRQGILMQLPALDELTDGFKPSRMYVIGARPKVGKTVFGINAALRCALEGKTVLYFNREMEKEDMVQRMAANVSGVKMSDMERGTVPEAQWEHMSDVIFAMDQLPMHICNGAKTPAEIRAKVSEVYEKHGLGMVVVDYLQRIRGDGKYRSKDEEIGAISFALKDIAMDFKVPVLLLSQLNRSATNVRPNMSMLRESGNIEQDADVIILLHDPERDELKPKRQADFDRVEQMGGQYREIIVDGNRHGSTGILCVGFYGEKMRYEAI